MVSLLGLSIKRSLPLYMVMGMLYLLAFIQLDVFLFARSSEQLQNPLLEVGFSIAVIGFLLGLQGVQYIVLQHFSYEMGNLETLGYRRSQYIIFYTLQFGISCFVAWLISVPVFSLLSGLVSDITLSFSKVANIHLLTGSSLVALTLFSVLLFSAIHSARDPLLLMKEKL